MTLIESIAALALEAIVMIGLASTIAAATELTAQLREQRHTIVDARRVEQLLDHAFALAGAGPTGSAAIVAADPARVVLHSDLDGDGAIDPRSSERTEFSLRRDGSSKRLVHRIGRQSVTVVRGLPTGARLSYRDINGRSTQDPLAIRLVRIPLGSVDYAVALPAPTS